MRTFLILFLVLVLSAAVDAEEIELITGKVIEGEVVEETPAFIRINDGNNIVKIPRRMIFDGTNKLRPPRRWPSSDVVIPVTQEGKERLFGEDRSYTRPIGGGGAVTVTQPTPEEEKRFEEDLKAMETRFVEEGSLKIVDDPATQKAFIQVEQQQKAMMQACPQADESPEALEACYCAHLEEYVRAAQIRSDAFFNLLSRNPALENEMIKVKGTNGTWFLNRQSLQDNKMTVERASKMFNCGGQ